MPQYEIKNYLATPFNLKEFQEVLAGKGGWQLLIKVDYVIIQIIDEIVPIIEKYFSAKNAQISKVEVSGVCTIEFPE